MNKLTESENHDFTLKLVDILATLVDVFKAPAKLQMELVELLKDYILKSMLDAKI